MPLSKSKKSPSRKARDVPLSKSKKTPARNARCAPKADYKFYMPVREHIQYLTIAEIPLMTSRAVHPALWLELTPELHKQRRKTLIEHQMKLTSAIKQGSINPLNATTKKVETTFNDESLVERRLVAKFAATLGIKMKPMLELSMSPRPVKVEPALLEIPRRELILYHYKSDGLNESGIGAAGEYIDELNARIKRQAKGFFTLAEAAQVLADSQPGIDVKEMIEQMRNASANGNLRIRNHGDQLPVLNKKDVKDYHSLVKISDIDTWLESLGVDYRFPPASAESKPQSEADVQSSGPLQRQRFQETEILRVINELGYTATALPKNKSGKPGVKAAVREKLTFSVTIFNKAWDRLRAQGEIADA